MALMLHSVNKAIAVKLDASNAYHWKSNFAKLLSLIAFVTKFAVYLKHEIKSWNQTMGNLSR